MSESFSRGGGGPGPSSYRRFRSPFRPSLLEGEKFKTKVENVDCTSLSEKDLSSLQKELSAWISDTERDLRTVGEAFVQRFRVTDKRQSSIRLGCDSLGIMELDNQVEMYLNNLRNMTQ